MLREEVHTSACLPGDGVCGWIGSRGVTGCAAATAYIRARVGCRRLCAAAGAVDPELDAARARSQVTAPRPAKTMPHREVQHSDGDGSLCTYLAFLHSLQAVTALALVAVRHAFRMSELVGITARVDACCVVCRAAIPTIPDKDRTRTSGLDTVSLDEPTPALRSGIEFD